MATQFKYGLLFDCDGTVVDKESLQGQFWNEQKKIYHPEIDRFQDCILGCSLNKILELYFSDDQKVPDLIRKKLDDFEDHFKFEYFPGTKELLQNLINEGVPSALDTSSNDKKLKKIINSDPEFNEFFKCIITADKVSKPKPDPEGYIKGSKSINVDPKRCIVFEDSINGIKAVKAAGCFVVGLTTSKPKEEIEKIADVVVENLGTVTVDFIEKKIVPRLPN